MATFKKGMITLSVCVANSEFGQTPFKIECWATHVGGTICGQFYSGAVLPFCHMIKGQESGSMTCPENPPILKIRSNHRGKGKYDFIPSLKSLYK